MKRNLIIWVILSCNYLSYGQQIPNWSGFQENLFIWNPSFTTAFNYWEMNASHRQEWTGFVGAPQYSTLSIQFPLQNKTWNNSSLGLLIDKDRIGPYDRVGLAMSYAYRFNVSWPEKEIPGEFGLGFLANFSQVRFVFDNLITFDQLDEHISENEISRVFSPNVAFGFFYRSANGANLNKRHYYFGGSGNYVLPSNHISNPSYQLRTVQHIMFISGMKLFPSGEDASFDLSIASIAVSPKLYNVISSIKYEKTNKYWATAGYNSNRAFFLQSGFFFKDYFAGQNTSPGRALKIGFRIDYSLSDTSNFRGMGYEFLIGYARISK